MPDYFPLGNFNDNLQSQANNVVQADQSVDFTSFNRDHFFNSIKQIDSMPHPDLVILIKNHIDLIVDQTLSDNKDMGPILGNPKFITAYAEAMRIVPMTFERRLFANKLSYEYEMVEHDPACLNIFRSVSEYANDSIIKALAGINIPANIANDLAICRFSSRKESVNILRLNFKMCQCGPDIFTEQMVVWTYEILFDRISELFIRSMLEVYSDAQLNEFGEDFRDTYGNISLAILTILNNMPKISIREVIIRYMDEFEIFLKKYHTLPRFTLRALSYDYGRIVDVVEEMLAEGKDVP